MRGAGRVVFAAILLLIVGALNIVYGIGAIDNANVFVNDTRLVFSDLSAYGWILILLGLVQVTGGFSLMAGNAYGRVIGIIGASVGAFWSLVAIGGTNPWWSLGVCVLCIYVLFGIVAYGEEEETV